MQTNFTLSEQSKLAPILSNKNYIKELQPQKATLQRILQFAAMCKAEKISENWVIDIYLN